MWLTKRHQSWEEREQTTILQRTSQQHVMSSIRDTVVNRCEIVSPSLIKNGESYNTNSGELLSPFRWQPKTKRRPLGVVQHWSNFRNKFHQTFHLKKWNPSKFLPSSKNLNQTSRQVWKRRCHYSFWRRPLH
jgi:hypothetical protein